MSAVLIVLGAGGHGRECAWIAEEAMPGRTVVFAETEGTAGGSVDGRPRLSLAEAARRHPGAAFVAGVGTPATRQRVADAALTAGLVPTVLVHPSAVVSPDAVLGPGVVLFPQTFVSRGVRLGPHVHLNVGSSVSHDCVLGACATLSPGARLAGNVSLEEQVLVGIGASVINGRPGAPLVIGPRAVVGAGACVVGPVAGGAVVVGVPARARGARGA